MKALTVVFGVGVVGVALSLVMTIYTSVQENKVKNEPPPFSIPTPAISPN